MTSVPLKYTATLQMSYFAGPYFEEKLKNMMDSLNLLYVATTRPKQELHIWIREEAEQSKGEDLQDRRPIPGLRRRRQGSP